MRYFIGLDNGGTATKAAIFDEKGREIAKASVSTRALTPKPGFVERDMEEMWEANCTVLRQALVCGLGQFNGQASLFDWVFDFARQRAQRRQRADKIDHFKPSSRLWNFFP